MSKFKVEPNSYQFKLLVIIQGRTWKFKVEPNSYQFKLLVIIKGRT